MDAKNVVSLELAKKLAEAGWKKETTFAWALATGQIVAYPLNKDIPYWVPAPLATEILEELPAYLYPKCEKETNDMLTITPCMIQRRKHGCRVQYGWQPPLEQSESLPDALAKMWLYLKDANLTGGER